MLGPGELRKYAEMLIEAERQRKPIERITLELPKLSLEDAYRIQDKLIELKTDGGERVIGWKLGFTSKTKQKAWGINEIIYGRLLDSMLLTDYACVDVGDLIHPKVEPEIAFVLGREIRGPATASDVLEATRYVVPAIEVLDSRFIDFKFNLPDVIADNTSAARIVLGASAHPVDEIDLRLLGLIFVKNGEIVATASGAAVMGNPAEAVSWLINKLTERNQSLAAGSIIMSGGICDAIDLRAGDVVSAVFDRIGSVTLRCQ